MEYIPFLIPTLNRKEHLKRCLESLSKNLWANRADVYVSVDYPPNEKYIKGYEEVKEYLNNAEALRDSFHKFEVFYQKENLGPHSNMVFLFNHIQNNYDRYILSEDDNEFSINFIEYIVKCLNYFKNDKRVCAICGFSDADYFCSPGDNVVASKLYPAYGVGGYIKTREENLSKIPAFLLNPDTYSRDNLKALKKKNRVLYNLYLVNVLLTAKPPFWYQNELCCIDTVMSIYMHFTDAICISPTDLKSRTWGNDGSGVNMKDKKIDVQKVWKLDCLDSFEVKAREQLIEFDSRNYKVGEKALREYNSIKFNVKADLFYLVLLLCRFDRIKAQKVLRPLLERR